MTDKIILKTKIEHNQTCVKSGKNACSDFIHCKEEWTKNNCELLCKVLENYYPTKSAQN